MIDRKILISDILYSLHRFKHHVKKQCMVDKMEISHSQWVVLMLLHKKGEQAPISFFAKELGISLPAMSQLVVQMEEKGWLERSKSKKDRRRSVLLITSEGESLLQKLKDTRIDQVSKLLEVLTDEELENFRNLHKKISLSLDVNNYE